MKSSSRRSRRKQRRTTRRVETESEFSFSLSLWGSRAPFSDPRWFFLSLAGGDPGQVQCLHITRALPRASSISQSEYYRRARANRAGCLCVLYTTSLCNENERPGHYLSLRLPACSYIYIHTLYSSGTKEVGYMQRAWCQCQWHQLALVRAQLHLRVVVASRFAESNSPLSRSLLRVYAPARATPSRRQHLYMRLHIAAYMDGRAEVVATQRLLRITGRAQPRVMRISYYTFMP